MSFNQRKYIDSYNKSNYKMFPFRVRKDDKKIIDKLISEPSMNKYIYNLISNDISRNVLTIKEIKNYILSILSKHNIHEVYLFGSYARGEATTSSDIDLYCEPGDIKTFIDQGFLEDELKEATNKNIDIVFIGSRMDDYFKEQLDEDKIRIS